MSDKLEQVSVEVIKAMLDNLGQAKHFVLEQAPDVMREIVLLGRVYAVLALVGGIFFAWLTRWCFRRSENNSEWGFQTALAGTATALCLLRVVIEGITPWVAPKVYLMQQLADMLK